MISIRHLTALMGSVAMGATLLMATPAFAASNGSGQTMTMEATAYGPSAQDNYPYGATNYFGQPLTAGDIAVDPSVIPLHSCVKVTGYNSSNLPSGGFIGEADDEGDAIQGAHIDIFMNTSESQVNNFGIQHVQVTVLGKAASTSLSGTAACAAYASGSSNNSGSSSSSSNTGSSNSNGSQSNGGSSQTYRSGHNHQWGNWSGKHGDRWFLSHESLLKHHWHHHRHHYGSQLPNTEQA